MTSNLSTLEYLRSNFSQQADYWIDNFIQSIQDKHAFTTVKFYEVCLRMIKEKRRS